MINDTIVAIASAAGRGAVGVIRVSGPQAKDIMLGVCGKALTPRHATHLRFLDDNGEAMDDGLAIFFPGPHSYTGEDVLELQGHGGLGVMQMILGRCLSFSGQEASQSGVVRLAQPGEFTQRAFMNDKLDLVQAEAVADLIDAGSVRAARSALASLQGRFSESVKELERRLIDLRLRVEACLDFPEEDIEFIAREGVSEKLQSVTAALVQTLASATRGAALREGLRVVLVGSPNVGKSSLLNALAEQDIALVTDIAGTTRDRIVQEIVVDGVPIHVTDTAGLRHSDDPVEQMGIARTWQEVALAQAILLLRDASGQIPIDHDMEAEILKVAAKHEGAPQVIRVWNKQDMVSVNAADHQGAHGGAQTTLSVASEQDIAVSAKTGQGLDLLRGRLLQIAGWTGDASAGVFSARQRHLDALHLAQQSLHDAALHLSEAELDLLAECLRQAQLSLSAITGEFSSDDLLGEIFGRFCIGK